MLRSDHELQCRYTAMYNGAMKEAVPGEPEVLSTKEIEDLLVAITAEESKQGIASPWVHLRKVINRLKRKQSKHLINTVPDETDLPGVSQIWFNDEIQIPIWTDADGNVIAFRVYPEQILRREGQAPFLEWSLKQGYVSSESPPSLRWVKRQFQRGSIGGFGQMQDWGNSIAKAIKKWPRRWECKYEMTDRAIHLAE
jgi:hypothetical protein